MNRVPLAITVLLLVASSITRAADADTEREVAHLIEFVAASGCTFNRNGSQHDSADAAEHLQLKYRRGKRWVNTAEQFIDRLASSSSLSKKPYTITCAGTETTAASWLHAELASYRASTAKDQTTPTAVPGTTASGL